VCREVLTRLTLIIPIENTNSVSGQSDGTSATGADSPVPAPHHTAAATVEPSETASVSTLRTSSDGRVGHGSGHSAGSGSVSGGGIHPRPGGSASSVSAESDPDAGTEAWFDIEGRDMCYLLPALLAEQNATPAAPHSPYAQNPVQAGHTGSTVSFAQKGWIRLERRFTFSRFVPSAIVPRIIAKMYSRFGQVLKTSSASGMVGEGPERSTCWNSAFIQEYGDCRVWILFEEDLAGNVPVLKTPGTRPHQHASPSAPPTFTSPRSRLASRDLGAYEQADKIRCAQELGISYELAGASQSTEAFETESLEAIVETGLTKSFTFEFDEPEYSIDQDATPRFGNGDSGKLSAYTNEEIDETNMRVVQLRIVSFGHLLNVNAVVDALDDYNAAVREILSEYRGVSQVFPTTLCPVCLLKQLPVEQCGQFHHIDRDAMAKSLADLCAQPHPTPASLVSEYRAWERHWMAKLDCPIHKCLVKPEFLVHVPAKLREAISSEDQLDSLTAYIRNDIVNHAVDREQQMIPANEEAMTGALVRVVPIYSKQLAPVVRDWYRDRWKEGTALPEFTFLASKVVTGTVVTLMDRPVATAHTASPSASAQTEVGRPLATAVLTSFGLHAAEHRSDAHLYFLVGGK
jgi:hypothetical protein